MKSTLTYFDLHRTAPHSKTSKPYVCCCLHILISMCMWCICVWFFLWCCFVCFAVAIFRSHDSKEAILGNPSQPFLHLFHTHFKFPRVCFQWRSVSASSEPKHTKPKKTFLCRFMWIVKNERVLYLYFSWFNRFYIVLSLFLLLGTLQNNDGCHVEFNLWTKPDCAGTPYENLNRSWFFFSIQGKTCCLQFNCSQKQIDPLVCFGTAEKIGRE